MSLLKFREYITNLSIAINQKPAVERKRKMANVTANSLTKTQSMLHGIEIVYLYILLCMTFDTTDRFFKTKFILLANKRRNIPTTQKLVHIIFKAPIFEYNQKCTNLFVYFLIRPKIQHIFFNMFHLHFCAFQVRKSSFFHLIHTSQI